MPPSGYLSAAGVEACLSFVAASAPSFTQLISLPHLSLQGRQSSCFRLVNQRVTLQRLLVDLEKGLGRGGQCHGQAAQNH